MIFIYSGIYCFLATFIFCIFLVFLKCYKACDKSGHRQSHFFNLSVTIERVSNTGLDKESTLHKLTKQVFTGVTFNWSQSDGIRASEVPGAYHRSVTGKTCLTTVRRTGWMDSAIGPRLNQQTRIPPRRCIKVIGMYHRQLWQVCLGHLKQNYHHYLYKCIKSNTKKQNQG